MDVNMHYVGLKLYFNKNERANILDQYSKIEEISSRYLSNQADENSKAQLKVLTSNPVKMREALTKLGFKTQEVRKLVTDIFFNGKSSWSHGDPLTREEAEAKLKDAPIGTWLLRYSKEQYVITRKEEKGNFTHISKVGTLDQVLDGIFYNHSESFLLLAPRVLTESSYHYGDIGNEQAIELLKNVPIGVGLLRYSSSKNKHYFSVKVSSDNCIHIPCPTKFSENGYYNIDQIIREFGKRKELQGVEVKLISKLHSLPHILMTRGIQIEQEMHTQQAALSSSSTVRNFDALEKMTKELPPTNLAHSRYYDISCPGLTSIRFGNEILHANVVQLGDMNYICAQAPLKEDLELFWKTAYFGSEFILDMTSNNEFYPEKVNETKTFGSISVKCVNTELMNERPDAILYTYSVTGPKDTVKTIKRLHYKAWPDHGVVDSGELMNIIGWFGQHKGQQYPIVHCTAGVGRTGTFCVANSLLEEIKSRKIDQSRSLEALNELILMGRYQRGAQFVQTQGQYDLLVELAKKEIS